MEECSLWVGSDLLTQVKEFKYLRGLVQDGKMGVWDGPVGWCTMGSIADVVPSIVGKKELSWKMKPSIFQSTYVLTLTYYHLKE